MSRQAPDEPEELEAPAPERDAGGGAVPAAAVEQLREDVLELMAHDIIASLSSIRVRAQALSRDTARQPDIEELKRVYREIVERTGSIADQVRTFLDISRLEAGHLPLRRQLFSIEETIDAVLAGLPAQSRQRVTLERADDPPLGEWDADRIRQVLQNLLENALKYSQGASPVRVGVVARPDEVEISVSDSGIGIAPEEMPKLFDRFYRSPRTRRSSVGGIGLGLYGCKRIVEAHGGRLWAESDGRGRGAVFRLSLPLPETGAE